MKDDARNEAQPGNPWWREPWPWIIMAGPALAVIGCIITIVLALGSYGNEAIVDGGVKRGLVVSKVNKAPAASASQQ
jgi:hypothetical protein